jgi:trehalose-phosphatase
MNAAAVAGEPASVGPEELAAIVGRAAEPVLLGLDVDGVLAPIVERADRAVLSPGVLDLLVTLAERLPVAVVSGRSLGDLIERFGFPDGIEVVGSHGLEVRGVDGDHLELDPEERYRLDQLRLLATEAADTAGPGAWLEDKPASVVLHVREADPDRAASATDGLLAAVTRVPGAQVKPGHAVVELLARPTSKADAITALRAERGVATVVFLGDDHTDEDVFAVLDAHDVAVRVGPGATRARYRLDGPGAVVEFLTALAARTG